MTTKELIQAEIEGIGEEHLEDLYRLVRSFAESRHDNRQQSFMSKLKRIQLDAPEDFAANLDLYISEEKRAE